MGEEGGCVGGERLQAGEGSAGGALVCSGALVVLIPEGMEGN